MKEELKSALERVGYNELYERHIAGLGGVSGRGERIARSPFPDVIDNDPSFSVNVYTGLWHCFKSKRGGNYVQFRALMEASEFDNNGLAIPDFDATERDLLVEFGIVNPITPAYVDQCRDALQAEPSILHNVQRYKPWDVQTLHNLSIGYDASCDRITIPIYDRQGKLVNCKLYWPGRRPKYLWKVANFGGNFLFPDSGWHEQMITLVEGEADAISLRCIGIHAVTGTVGAGAMVPPGEWWRNKVVHILPDTDEAGMKGCSDAIQLMGRLATDITVMKLPDWPGRPDNADISDYLMYLTSIRYSMLAQQRAIVEMYNTASRVEHAHAIFDVEATETTFQEAFSGKHLNKRISFVASILARSERRYFLPTAYNIICPAQGHNYCRRCPMHSDYHGNAYFTHDPRSDNTLKLIRVDDKHQMDALKVMHGIMKQCPDPQLYTQTSADIDPIMLGTPTVDYEGQDPGVIERHRRESLAIVPFDKRIQENHDYVLEGFMYSEPKSQHQIFLIDKFSRSIPDHELFKMTPEIYEKLQIFRPRYGETEVDKLVAVANDLASSVTLIKGRLDLHLAYRSVWHSILHFNFCGTVVHRGWMEALVIGDTRCGKSATFLRLAKHYRLGHLIDCKLLSSAGVMAGVVQSQSGERYALGGVLPQQDGRIVCFDEFTASREFGQQSILDVLSSTRSEGVVRISKIVTAQFRARVRSIWLANPGQGELLSELGITGVEVISRIIQQPEDIARFDIALAVSQEDVPMSVMNEAIVPEPALYPQASAKLLLSWAHSRRPDQVVFTKDAELAVIALVMEMCGKYDASVPLVEPADQRIRIAKLAVSIAAQCFSTDAEGELLIVRPEHVYAARSLFFYWYDSRAMGYNIYSTRIREERTIRDEAAVTVLLHNAYGSRLPQLAEILLRLDEFTARSFSLMVPTQVAGFFVNNIIQELCANRCLKLVKHGRRETYQLTPAFVAYLKRITNTYT